MTTKKLLGILLLSMSASAVTLTVGCSGTVATVDEPNSDTDEDALKVRTCESAGGSCVGLAPSSCASGRVGDANHFTCGANPGANVGIECCLQACPEIVQPPPNFCPSGKKIKPTKDASGCVLGFKCVSDSAVDAGPAPMDASPCPEIVQPSPNFCGGGPYTPKKNAAGCIVGFDCTVIDAGPPPVLDAGPPSTTCAGVGGTCVGVYPGSCAGGTTVGGLCGNGVGVTCCIHDLPPHYFDAGVPAN